MENLWVSFTCIPVLSTYVPEYHISSGSCAHINYLHNARIICYQLLTYFYLKISLYWRTEYNVTQFDWTTGYLCVCINVIKFENRFSNL